MLKRLPLGLRARLLLLVVIAVIPAFGIIGYLALHEREHNVEHAQKNASMLVRLVAREQSQLIDSTHQLLVRLSQLPAVASLESAPCNRTVSEIQRSYSYYNNIGVIRRDGIIVCSALPFAKKINSSDLSYFRRAIESRGFGIGDYQIGRITGQPAINFGYPVFGADGSIKGVVFAALNLEWLGQIVDNVELPVDSVVVVVDYNGTVLARLPRGREWIGKSFTDVPLVETILERRRADNAEVRGLDGVERLFSFAPLYESAAGNVYVAVGISKVAAHGDADDSFVRYMLLLVAAGLAAVVATWLGSKVFILRRVNALIAAARRLREGDFSARTGLPYADEELGQLAKSFDSMAENLQRVNRALKTLSAGNRAMVRATDEESLLQEMCRVIVEVGGYQFAFIGYAEQNDEKSVRVVAQHGFAGGLVALRDAMPGLSWADNPHGRGAIGTAIRTGKPVMRQDFLNNPTLAPWRHNAVRFGFNSVGAFPLRIKDRVIGALAIYSAELDAFNPDEIELLEEAANDLSFGISVLSARSESDRAQAMVRHMAYYDALTGLPNHTFFDEHIYRVIREAESHGRSLALLVVDLYRLREINDALGFHQGDALLKQASTRIRGSVDDNVMVARLRGDEFGVLLPLMDKAQVEETARRVLRALVAPYTVSGLSLDVGAAIGISLYPDHGAEPTRLIRCADVAMQQAKKTSKDFVFYSVEQDEGSTRRVTMAGELRRAIEVGELVLYYQPKLDMVDGRVCGAEALVRWAHPKRGIVVPDEFIPLADHTGLIKPLTDWVMAAALRQSSAWRAAGVTVPVAVNLSPRSLRDIDLVEKVQRLFTNMGAQPGWLEFELTEGAVMEDPEGALDVLRRLSDMGIALFIDDFGTGYSSLSYLKKLPVDAVKIDKSFVTDMLMKTDSAAIVRSTIGLAHDLGLKVVAEGVEDEAMWDSLAAQGCDVAQGYFISRPLPADKFTDWLQEHGRHSKAGKRVPRRTKRN